jgi:hypothetical protein
MDDIALAIMQAALMDAYNRGKRNAKTKAKTTRKQGKAKATARRWRTGTARSNPA